MGLELMGWLVAMTGCGTETGNPEGDVSVLYNARSQVPELISLEPSSGVTMVDAVWLRLEAVTLAGDCAGDESSDVAFAPLGLADHAGDEAFEQVRAIPKGPYCGLTTALVPGDDGDELTAGASVVVEGSLPDGRAFAVVVDETVDLQRSLDALTRPDTGSWLMTFDVGTWIDPSELAPLLGDPVMVSTTENADVLARVVERIPEGVQLHHDLDGNGLVDSDEPRLDLP